jgi:hypothetical protein
MSRERDATIDVDPEHPLSLKPGAAYDAVGGENSASLTLSLKPLQFKPTRESIQRRGQTARRICERVCWMGLRYSQAGSCPRLQPAVASHRIIQPLEKRGHLASTHCPWRFSVCYRSQASKAANLFCGGLPYRHRQAYYHSEAGFKASGSSIENRFSNEI